MKCGRIRKLCNRKVYRLKKEEMKQLVFSVADPLLLTCLILVLAKRAVSRHHMTNKSRWRKRKVLMNLPLNVLMMKVSRHRKLHQFFGNLSWEAIGEVLRSGATGKVRAFRGKADAEIEEALFSIFHRKSPRECVRVIDRISRAKGRKGQKWCKARKKRARFATAA